MLHLKLATGTFQPGSYFPIHINRYANNLATDFFNSGPINPINLGLRILKQQLILGSVSRRKTKDLTRAQEIWVNGRALLRRTTGVERYAAEVTGLLPKRARTIFPAKSYQGWFGHLWEQFILPLHLPRKALLWSPANSGPLLIERQVVTIHDLGPLEHPEWFQPQFTRFYHILLPSLIGRVQAVLVPSDYVKTRLLEFFPGCEDKTYVVPEGVNFRCFYPRRANEIAPIRQKYHLPVRFILTLGTLQPRKNIANLLAAWGLFHVQQPDLSLVIVGGVGSQFRKVSLKTTPAGVRFLGYVPDHELPLLYSSAVGYVCASLDEGFGLTLLEAMACGTPIVSSWSGALPDLLDGAGLLFDPQDPQEIAAALERLVTCPELCADLIERGYARARYFSWEKTAHRVWELLQAIA
jgi:glycosyltransferase involved in cell wall biosynthesis